jgi:hypothetical protein
MLHTKHQAIEEAPRPQLDATRRKIVRTVRIDIEQKLFELQRLNSHSQRFRLDLTGIRALKAFRASHPRPLIVVAVSCRSFLLAPPVGARLVEM